LWLSASCGRRRGVVGLGSAWSAPGLLLRKQRGRDCDRYRSGDDPFPHGHLTENSTNRNDVVLQIKVLLDYAMPG
jgi:hypothetical protein